MNAPAPRPRECGLLMICYDFPMLWGAGVIRTYQLAKHLAGFGWRPIILSARRGEDAKEGDIERSDGPLGCPLIAVKPWRILVPRQDDHATVGEPVDGPVPKPDGAWKRAVHFVSLLAVPDGKVGWVPAAAHGAIRAASDHRIDACFSTSPRPTSHLVARRVARALKIPWVADFSLPWADAYWLRGRPRFAEWLDRQVEGLVIRSARHVSVAYPEIGRTLGSRHGSSMGSRTSVIHTGFADELFQDGPRSPGARFTLLYPGGHFCEPGRSGEAFLRALDEWIDANPGRADKVQCVFLGRRDDELLRGRAAMRHSRVVRIEPPVPHRACIRAIVSADASLVNTVGNRIPAKVYECMRSGRWLLALAESGSDLAALVGRYPRAITVPPGDVAGIREALETIWRRRGSGALWPHQESGALARYSSRRSAELMAGVLDRLVVSPADEPAVPTRG